MAASMDVDNNLSEPGDDQKDNLISDKIPGGEKQEELEEPTSTEGCTSSKNIADDEQESVSNQIKFDKRNDDIHRNTTDSSNKKPKGSPTDDDDFENYGNSQRSGPTTRSSATLSKIRDAFSDSEDENSSYHSYAQRDINEYRNNYPNNRSNSRITDNLDFYTNKISSHPDGDLIDNIHKEWIGDYRKLEVHHGFIQWLFPLQEKGLNWSAEPLQKHEIESIKNNKKALKRILVSYKLMLDFYGFQLVDEKTGEIRRSKGDSYKERFRNLNRSSHNYLRITRILKCLGEFDYEYLKFPFLEAILREIITENTLSNCLRSCKDYWIETLRSREERRAIRQYARELIEYRNKGISPPEAHRAQRPTSTTTTEKVTHTSLPDDHDMHY